MLARTRTGPFDVDYPDCDRRSGAMSDQHRCIMDATIQTLRAYFSSETMVYVSGNTPVHFSRKGRLARLIPDVFVVRDVPNRMRRGYHVREEGKAPDVVIELTSPSSLREDAEWRLALYERALAVSEFFLFDPSGTALQPSLQGFRLFKGGYLPIGEENGRLPSKVLGLHLEGRGRDLRLYDPAAGQWLPTPQETAVRAEEARREAEKARRQAEAEVKRLRRELGELRRRSTDPTKGK